MRWMNFFYAFFSWLEKTFLVAPWFSLFSSHPTLSLLSTLFRSSFLYIQDTQNLVKIMPCEINKIKKDYKTSLNIQNDNASTVLIKIFMNFIKCKMYAFCVYPESIFNGLTFGYPFVYITYIFWYQVIYSRWMSLFQCVHLYIYIYMNSQMSASGLILILCKS